MKGQITTLAIAAAFAVSLLSTAGPALASGHITGNGSPAGGGYTVNLVGHPNLDEAIEEGILGGKAYYSGGHSIFMPITTKGNGGSKKDAFGGFCTSDDGEQTKFEDNSTAPANVQDAAPTGGARIHFDWNQDGKFEITDRVMDKDGARINVPVTDTADRWIMVDLWVRILGKPGGCAEIDGYAVEADADPKDGGDLWWHSGSILMDREAKKSPYVNATDIFEVSYCDVIWNPELNAGAGGYECDSAITDISVFKSVFESYFWALYTDNVRLIQLKFTTRTVFP